MNSSIEAGAGAYTLNNPRIANITNNFINPKSVPIIESLINKSTIPNKIPPMSFTKHLRGTAKLGVSIYRVFGFAPKREFTSEEYKIFLHSIGFENCENIQMPGKIPMVVAVWKK